MTTNKTRVKEVSADRVNRLGTLVNSNSVGVAAPLSHALRPISALREDQNVPGSFRE